MLRRLHSAAYNAWTAHHSSAQERVARYLECATSTMQQLSSQIASADLDRLSVTPDTAILSIAGTMASTDVATRAP